MGTDFTPVPDTRAVGTGNPPADIDNIADELAAIGGTLNVLDANFAGGADPTGAADSYPAISAALTAAPAGTAVTIPPGIYKTTAPLAVPAQVAFVSQASSLFPPLAGAVITPSAAFSGAAVVTTGSGAVIRGVSIDGSALTGSVTGIGGGTAVNCVVDLVYIYHVSGIGIDASAGARGWHVTRVKVDGVGAQGVACSSHTDGYWQDVHVIGSVGHGWSIAGPVANSRFIACRAEWTGAGKDGFHLAGTWNSGTGSGGVVFSGCTTDRNDNNGFSINVTGTIPITVTGGTFRRDGRNGNSGGGGFAGLNVLNTTAPVLIGDCSVFPGVDDNGTGTNSPVNAVNLAATNTLVALSNCLFHGATTGINGTSGASFRNVWTRTGTTASPSAPSLTADTA